MKSCESDNDCKKNEYKCTDNICLKKCNQNSDCSEGRCDNGIYEFYCDENDKCPDNEVCINNKCYQDPSTSPEKFYKHK